MSNDQEDNSQLVPKQEGCDMRHICIAKVRTLMIIERWPCNTPQANKPSLFEKIANIARRKITKIFHSKVKSKIFV